MSQFKQGDRVSWTYDHYLNSTASTRLTKCGTFQGPVRHKGGYRGRRMAWVLFDGNLRKSRVMICQLREVE